MKIVPRSLQVHRKNAALQQNALIGHRSAVLGAWFMADDNFSINKTINDVKNVNNTSKDEKTSSNGTSSASPGRVVSVAADNVVIT